LGGQQIVKTALLLSGGMDSLSIAWWKRPDIAITVDYGQRPAKAEIQVANAICEQLGIQHEIITVDCGSLGSGDMAGTAPSAVAPASDWWPYRNQMLITLASMRAVVLDVKILYVGAVKSDGFHRDGTLEFFDLVNSLVEYQEGGIKIQAPAIHLSTQELVSEAKVPVSLLALAHSCHKANLPCGNCRGCNKYNQTMFDLGYGNTPA
jgi:7-cyano-7-deazaguanine synthase